MRTNANKTAFQLKRTKEKRPSFDQSLLNLGVDFQIKQLKLFSENFKKSTIFKTNASKL